MLGVFGGTVLERHKWSGTDYMEWECLVWEIPFIQDMGRSSHRQHGLSVGHVLGN